MRTATTTAPVSPRRVRGCEDRALRHLHPLARYTQPDGLVREIFAFPAASGSRLVVDRLAGGLGDSRLLAHLAADEPAENAELVCRLYLADRNRGCRRLSSLDLKVAPQEDSEPEAAAGGVDLRDAGGNLYRICVPDDGRRRLRWTRRRPGQAPERGEEVSLREVVGALEDYEPARSITRHAVAASRPGISSYALRHELENLRRSPMVLNRRLREAVIDAIEHRELSMSEIAIRCRRVKRRDSGLAGETSWLARRVGLRPDSTSSRPTPWVHADVLALIARDGLGITPAEVEMD